MLRRLTLGFFLLACVAIAAACSSYTTTPSSGGVPGVGPNFVKNTIYVTNTTQQLIEIYTPSPAASATPQFTIGGANTTLSGPQYLSFNGAKQLFVTNFNPASNAASILEFQTFATGNVLPFGTVPLSAGVHARGIAAFSDNSGYVVAATQPGGVFPNVLQVYTALGLTNTIAGSNTGLNVPVGVAVDSSKKIYVANNGAPSVGIFNLPSPSPTPSGTPSPTPSPSPTPTGSPSSSPSPTPTPFSDNTTPATTIAGANTQLISPMGVAVDGGGNVYVADAGGTAIPATPKILIFNAPFGAGVQNIAPTHVIGSPVFVNPTDVKVDSAGNVYVIDTGRGPNSNSMLFIFAAGTFGAAVTPSTAITLPQGSAMGMALSP